MERRSTWTRWNLLAEAARASKTLRVATPAERLKLLERVAQIAIDEHCLQLTPPQLIPTVAAFTRADGASVFRRHRAEVFTSPIILAAEDRLLAAATTTTGPRLDDTTVAHVLATSASGAALAVDQRVAVQTIATSPRAARCARRPGRVRQDHHPARTAHGVGEHARCRGRWSGSHRPRPQRLSLRSRWGSGVRTPRNGSTKPHASSQPTRAIPRPAARRSCAGGARRAHRVGRRNRPAKQPRSRRVDRRFQLQPGQLLIVDEASLAGTLTLDQLATQASAAGAKLLLVGDHRQLASVDAGGAFGLLATTTNAVELTSLWRFDHAWEAEPGNNCASATPTASTRMRRTAGCTKDPPKR